MLDYTPPSELAALSKYDRIMVYLFRELTSPYSAADLPNEIPFTQQTVREAMAKAQRDGVIDKAVANVPDIKYTYDARRDLPQEVEQAGPMTWLQAGKGAYILRRTRRRNIIRLPDDLSELPELEFHADNTPPFIASLLGRDEQAVFTRVRNAGLINEVLGVGSAHPIQGHHRTTVSYGQIEVDEVQAAMGRGGELIIAPISGKGGQDKLSWSQALNLNTYALEKVPAAGHVKSIGLWRDNEDTIWIVQFSAHTNIDDIKIEKVRRFKFKLQAV
tara:strand:+ start:175 stop:996 length:822 start_codon:yes stop_codon:yes gene_type:complete